MVKPGSGVLRNYRTMTPTKFHGFNQRVATALRKTKFPESMWGGNPTLLPNYLAASDKHDAVYHQALYGSKLDIAEREVLQQQIGIYLDEIALVFEAAALHNPEILLSSGFDLSKDRRGMSRTKAAVTNSDASTTAQEGHEA